MKMVLTGKPILLGIALVLALTLINASSWGDSTATSITLAWTAPGDDGNSGTASMYDIRYSLSSITEGNWDAAIQVSGEPAPQPAGSQETFVVDGLQPGTVYYFAAKTADEASNWSALSNVVIKQTAPEDTPPAAVVDLDAAPGADHGEVLLTWTATGDNGNDGTAASYDIRYSLVPITPANWNEASRVNGEPTPQPAGSSESFTVGNLDPNIRYYFAIRVSDATGNLSGLSNVADAIPNDLMPPAPIIDLSLGPDDFEKGFCRMNIALFRG